jgi:hypothetical protein
MTLTLPYSLEDFDSLSDITQIHGILEVTTGILTDLS